MVFRDSQLLTSNASLKTAAESYGVVTKKGYLPHAYLQNCRSLKEILDRINTTVPWSTMEPCFIDWLVDAEHNELHKRVAGRTWKQKGRATLTHRVRHHEALQLSH